MPIETKENSTVPEYTKIGDISDFGDRLGKHQRIEYLHDLGFNIPKTLAVGRDLSPEELERASAWCQAEIEENKKEIMVRTDRRKGGFRCNMPFTFGEENSKYSRGKDIVDKALPLLTENDVLIFQSMEENNINRQILSVNFQWKKDSFKTEVGFEASPDIGTMINRLSLLGFKLDCGDEIDNLEIIRSEYLKQMILYRIGRIELLDAADLPKVEKLELDFIKRYNSVIMLGLGSIKDYPWKYPGPAFWYKDLSDPDKEFVFPELLKNSVNQEMQRIKRKAVSNKFPYQDGFVKMSFLINKEGNIYPVYLDIYN